MLMRERFIERDGGMAEKSGKYAATAQFAKIQRAEDAKKATSEYESTAVALRAKTERLKALRLARDAAAPVVPTGAADAVVGLGRRQSPSRRDRGDPQSVLRRAAAPVCPLRRIR